MAFTDAQKADIRRFCGYGAYGSQALPASGYRFSVAYGVLEYKMNNLLPEEEAVAINTYLSNLYTLEQAIPASGANLDTDSAAVWHHNKNEVRDRVALFNQWRLQFCGFLGIPPGPALVNAGQVSFVV